MTESTDDSMKDGEPKEIAKELRNIACEHFPNYACDKCLEELIAEAIQRERDGIEAERNRYCDLAKVAGEQLADKNKEIEALKAQVASLQDELSIAIKTKEMYLKATKIPELEGEGA